MAPADPGLPRDTGSASDGESEGSVEIDLGLDPDVNPIMADVLAAAESGDVDSLSGLFAQVGVDERGEDGDTALNIACLYGQKAVVDDLLKR